ncbi:gfo/Idh/MocA family oxidoreductase [Clostridium sp. AF19-22AC]|jgi:predicted dehydrogenase|uniref:Gfo/Idh/MocA family protein n=1 Tax=Clostridia TaxID=186801 RepID=UPI000E4F5206|nr:MULTISPECIES: Gfo/Idh/MocA family oxidoreductase [Clostridia]RHR28742.1 gfo/Idh/MocA family oxidoreductase [Clostridium sp. AF19-22AC]
MDVIKKINTRFKDYTNSRRPKKNPIKWGIIGTGYMATTFCRAIQGNEKSIVSAVYSRTNEKGKTFAKRFNIPFSTNKFQDFFDGNKFDIVYIATPTHHHYEHVKKCLCAGFNVLCEKPLVTSLKNFDELQEIARKNKCFLMEGMWSKCLPTFAQAQKWIKEKRIGSIELIRVDFYKNQIRMNPDQYISKNDYGVLNDYGIYALSFPQEFLSGKYIMSWNKRIIENNIDTDWAIILDSTESKAFLNISSNFKGESRARIYGNDGSIEFGSQFNRTNTVSLYNRQGNLLERKTYQYIFDGFEYQVNEVHSCLQTGRLESNLIPLKKTRQTLLIMSILRKENDERRREIQI